VAHVAKREANKGKKYLEAESRAGRSKTMRGRIVENTMDPPSLLREKGGKRSRPSTSKSRGRRGACQFTKHRQMDEKRAYLKHSRWKKEQDE